MNYSHGGVCLFLIFLRDVIHKFLHIKDDKYVNYDLLHLVILLHNSSDRLSLYSFACFGGVN